MVQSNFYTEPDVPLVIKETVYRISQEAIHNIIKHARATQVTLLLACCDRQIYLEVRGNGIGFDPAAAFPGHLGLQSMQERAAKNKGWIRIESSSGCGTTVQVTLPNR